MTTSFWLNDPTILLKQEDITQIWPSQEMSSDEKLNAITRLVVILSLLGYLVCKTYKIVLTGLVTVAAIVLLYGVGRGKGQKDDLKANMKEAFTSSTFRQTLKDDFTDPSVSNPAMNVLLPEINEDPNRKRAAPAFNPVVEKDMNDKTKKFVESGFDDPNIGDKLFKDLGDNFIFDQSMRTWYATANTQIPNDQHGFAEYCYGDMISCKEGNAMACMQGAGPRWINGEE
jgi:hypothetical protein